MITLCKKCVNPNTRPNIYFDKEGVCPVCRYEEDKHKDSIDWSLRDNELNKIIEWASSNKKTSYDCIVTVSGGKDSTRQAFYTRDELKLKPLLVSSLYPPEELDDRGPNNLANLIQHGFDTIAINVNPVIYKKLMKFSFYKFVNIFTAGEMALYAVPIHVAIAYKIPLIFLGENPALTIGEKHGKLDGDASQMKHGNTLAGGSSDRLLNEDLQKKDIIFYDYPPDDDMQAAELRLVYLGYYIRDWSGRNNAKFAIDRGLHVRDEGPEHTGDLWGFTGLDEDFRLVNQMIKYVKYGFGHVNDQVCEAITSGMMTREEGIDLLKKYDGKCDQKYIKKFCDYIEISMDEFWKVVDGVRSKEVWSRKNNNWVLNINYK